MGEPSETGDLLRAAARRIREVAHPEAATILALATWLESHADIHALRTCDERLVHPCPARAVARAYIPDAAEVRASEHTPLAVMSIDGIHFIKCSCGKNPVPHLWIEDHWPGDSASGEARLREVIAEQALSERDRDVSVVIPSVKVAAGQDSVTSRQQGGAPGVQDKWSDGYVHGWLDASSPITGRSLPRALAYRRAAPTHHTTKEDADE